MEAALAAKVSWFWVSMTAILVVVVILGGLLAWSRYDRSSAVEIALSERPQQSGTIYVGEGAAAPGAYPFTASDTVSDILAAAGGVKSGFSPNDLRLDIAPAGATQHGQRIDINLAEPWLLEALPGIGEVLSKRIVDFRQQNGSFRTTSDLKKVAGIGNDMYEKIKDMITVSSP